MTDAPTETLEIHIESQEEQGHMYQNFEVDEVTEHGYVLVFEVTDWNITDHYLRFFEDGFQYGISHDVIRVWRCL